PDHVPMRRRNPWCRHHHPPVPLNSATKFRPCIQVLDFTQLQLTATFPIFRQSEGTQHPCVVRIVRCQAWARTLTLLSLVISLVSTHRTKVSQQHYVNISYPIPEFASTSVLLSCASQSIVLYAISN